MKTFHQEYLQQTSSSRRKRALKRLQKQKCLYFVESNVFCISLSNNHLYTLKICRAKIVPNGLKLTQNWPQLSQMEQNCLNWAEIVPNGPKFIREILSHLGRFSLIWDNFGPLGTIWTYLARFYYVWDNFGSIGTVLFHLRRFSPGRFLKCIDHLAYNLLLCGSEDFKNFKRCSNF